MLPSLGLKSKIGLGLLLSYSSYALFVSFKANVEITRRAKIEKLRLENKLVDSSEVCDHVHEKYGSLTVAGRFENPFEEYRVQTLFEFFLSRLLELFEGESRGGLPSREKLRELLPVHTPDFELLEKSTFKGGDLNGVPGLKDRLTFTWLGQSCSFVQISGVNILTDPLFANYLVNRYLGPKRITPSPCELKDLPKPDFILVSHNHPDHLDLDAADKILNQSTWIVPMGIRKILAQRGIHNTIELDWWEKVRLPVSEDPENVYEVACTPAMHWSGRNLWDSNTSLWCSFLILKNGKPIFYHAGDTGYVSDLFTKISKKYGEGTRLAMLPMGQYCPQWHQKPRHINPGECLKIMTDLGAQKMVGVHWGTFVLSSEHFLEPKIQLETMAQELNKVNDIMVPKFGQTMVMSLKQEIASSVKSIRDGKSLLVK
jgi:L-ascorbate metabolism protein UlaG (beta-lactamase superfamily)